MRSLGRRQAGGEGGSDVTQSDVLRHVRRIKQRDWGVLNPTGRLLLVRCIRALERDTA